MVFSPQCCPLASIQGDRPMPPVVRLGQLIESSSVQRFAAH